MKSFYPKPIPNCLRKYRKSAGLKQKDVARILGIKNSGMISRWEKGACFPRPLTIFKLAVLYRTMADGLFIDLIRDLREEFIEQEKYKDK